MKRLLFVFCLTLTSCLSQNSCPSKEDINPCSCSIGVDQKPWVSCVGLTSGTALKNVVKGMKNYKFSNFDVEKSNIGVLEADTFLGLQIRSLNIIFSNITSISEMSQRPPFLGLENSLESLEIRDAFISEDNPMFRLSLSHLKKLTFLQLEGNVIPVLGNDWFESGPYGLKEAYLLDTYTKKVGSHVFSALNQLRKVSLTGGSVSDISRDMFPDPAIYLEAIDFSNNKLSILPKNIFSKMPSLIEVFLENNAFTTIDEVNYALVWSQLSHIFYYGNPLKCDQNMKWIFKYRLPESLQGQCASPPTLQYRSLNNLTLQDLE
ncbi:uncharacterized protein LOC129960010 [Argiope bruennichi]|uniref:Nyctalopin like protein n=1 Tax=Argiope bruennichi TaxID=94029 RepID=A0A8T0FKU4_ARGBR|nr:uncharacterized protein LOC129960010 [Argiope bruennichi]KAF8791631.1 Nyctalopin like protein [Argiope bruennichi]